MKTRTRKILLTAVAVLGLLVALRIGAAFVWPTINDVTTGATAEYPDLQPQRFDKPYDRVYSAALASALSMGLDVTAQSPERGEIRAVATTRLMRFKDDVTITVKPEPAGATVVVRSKSRIGKGDMGANARRIRAFQAAMAADPDLSGKR